MTLTISLPISVAWELDRWKVPFKAAPPSPNPDLAGLLDFQQMRMRTFRLFLLYEVILSF